ncbi:phosphatidylcholine transfer protein isoform X1 [Arvicanthis niloticus]|uniref:phosphatidylcholine transfer protein isoform X1 n=1 Tax=Arvicanthis niloticus TaxID=61156 RepID=UPI00402BABFF
MAGATGSFSDQQFREACAEIQQPALAGADWQLLVEASGITIYRLLDQPSGLYEYKVFGVLEGCLPALLADVYMDLDYRKKWDPYVKELYEKACDGQMVAYWEVKYPFPLSNRDYVYTRQRRDLDVDGRKIYVVLAQSISVPQFPEKSGVIRVKQYKQSLAIESDGKKGSRVFMYYFDNPGGQIPSWLINWAAKDAIDARPADCARPLPWTEASTPATSFKPASAIIICRLSTRARDLSKRGY